MTQTAVVPSSSGIGAPGTAPAPASLARSPMAAQGSPPSARAIPFTRGSSLATMKDATFTLAANTPQQVQVQTNAFLESLVMTVSLVTSGNSANVTFANDGPWNCIAQIKLDDPAGQSIITPLTGFQLYVLNKYLPDVDCAMDPTRDPGYVATTGTGSTGGSFTFRLVIPLEHRRRDALGAVNNSAANQRYLITITTVAAFSTIYGTAPSTEATTISFSFYQQYWTSPPSTIQTSQGSVAVQQQPTGLGTLAFVRYERHNEVSGGGSPQIQLNNVGDYLSDVIFTLRNSSNVRDDTDWPSEFDWWVNDFQVHALDQGDWRRWQARFYGYYAGTTAAATAGALDVGVYPLFMLHALFDKQDNYAPASQYLPTDATTKLQIRGSVWGSSASYLEVQTRNIRPVSGPALFS